MPQYLAPGVYVEPQEPKARPIAGVGTSTAGFIGAVAEDVDMPHLPGEVELDKDYQLDFEPLTSTDSLPKQGKSLVYIAKVTENTESFYQILIFDGNGNNVFNKGKNDFVPDPAFKSRLDTEFAEISDRVTANETTTGEIIQIITISLLRYQVADVNTPQLITNWEQFKNKFGDFQSGNQTLAHAVYGFFNNGGTRCWVIRLAALADGTDLKPALQQFAGIDEIAIVAVPGARDQTQQDDIMTHCENSKDRFAILDGNPEPEQLTVDDIKGEVRNSNFAALYFPWLKVANPNGGDDILQPPSGHIAGVYARVDGERGVFKAPANEVLRGVKALERRLSREDQGELNKAGINIIRNFNGNLKIWGARTLGGDDNGEFKYISTQRFFNFLRESIDEGTQFAVFEPNSPSLWQRIIRSVSDFLLNQWRDGALFGDTPQQAFFVRCNEETNPPEVRELGQVVTEIGVAIVKPAEFVIFRIEQLTGG